jgi:DNA (cytosine-5)-methyltransferase 1
MTLNYNTHEQSRQFIKKDGALIQKEDLCETGSEKSLPKVVSLFAGAGGLDLGFKDAGFTISVAIDAADAAIRTHRKNFPLTKSLVADLIELKPRGVVKYVMAEIPLGERIAVIGGPPCQGFSRANTGSQVDDPRNQMPTLYLKIVKELQRFYIVEFIVLENVLGIRDRKHASTYKALVDGIVNLGFTVTEKELCAVDFGVPQNRRRIVLSGLREGQGYSEVKPRKRNGFKTVREAIGALCPPVFFKFGLSPSDIPIHPNHWTMQPKSPRFANPDAETGDGRSFKRLKWDAPSPTIAFGHREIHVHPSGRRRLSIYEALLLQGFPKSFVLEGNLSEQVEQVSNAVPPPLARSVASAVRRSLNGK